MEKVTRLGLPNCYRLSNGEAEVVVTTDVGPRVVGYALAGGENVLGEVPGASVETPWGTFRPWGGHRLWTAPELMPRSYSPDNEAVDFESVGELSVRLTAPEDVRAGVQKELIVSLDASGSGVTVRHRVRNCGAWPVTLAAWGLTIMRGGGEAVIPHEPLGPHPEHLLPARALVLWPYTDMSDPRWTFGRRYLRLRADARFPDPQKIGAENKRGWAGYHVGETLFVKSYAYEETAAYPDGGCNTEVFTAGSFIEVESLSPLRSVEPGGLVEHEERWRLFDACGGTDAELDEIAARLAA